MAGPIPGAASSIASAVSIAAASSVTYEHDSGQCYFFELWADVSTDASSTAGVNVSVRRKTGASGTPASAGLSKSVAAAGVSDVLYLGIFDAGTVDIVVENTDATYAATLNNLYVRSAI